MIYTILAALAGLGGIAAFIFKLINDKKDLLAKLSQATAQQVLKEWDDQVKAKELQVKEDERDYDAKKKDFFDKYGNPPGDSGSQS